MVSNALCSFDSTNFPRKKVIDAAPRLPRNAAVKISRKSRQIILIKIRILRPCCSLSAFFFLDEKPAGILVIYQTSIDYTECSIIYDTFDSRPSRKMNAAGTTSIIRTEMIAAFVRVRTWGVPQLCKAGLPHRKL
jgi:hypothetical protein